MVPKSLEDEDVIKILEVLHSNWSDMQKEHNVLSNYNMAEFVHSSQTVPYHKAAIDFYKQGKGTAVWGEDANLRNQKLLNIWN